MTATTRVAIAGGGVAATALAIQLAREGVEVDMFDKADCVSALGSGITLQGNALRAFVNLGVWDQIKDAGYAFNGLTLRAPGPGAAIVADMPEIAMGGPDLPAGMGMYRPDLARILTDAAVAAGARLHHHAEVTGCTTGDSEVEVEVNGESVGTYGLLVGADGLHSKVRESIGIEVQPERTGMGIWRAFVPRPAEVTHTELYYGGPMYIAGYTPTGEDTMYAFLVEDAADHVDVTDEQAVEIMRGQSMAYDGPWNHIREHLSTASHVNYTWFTAHIIPGRWNRGRAVCVGDAAHSCPPTIAQGAAQALEDTEVLGELILKRDTIDQDFWDEFHARRVERATMVVESSTLLGSWLLEGRRDADVPGLVASVAQTVSVPA
ncbi:FAD-dependent monooxygenase [Demequina capsici]|uniref:FAD-dependent monooxygenase n=1 Tax=Demequina capsici TaxID=3075620 RepID=A0AA96FH66_9MICO|nr:FAD-dependent monooxygenase [Demequina sp. PMTSA13]WNM28460.1 FAD-dependent monooxygenase [Demequina sp. PMTSA13]